MPISVATSATRHRPDAAPPQGASELVAELISPEWGKATLEAVFYAIWYRMASEGATREADAASNTPLAPSNAYTNIFRSENQIRPNRGAQAFDSAATKTETRAGEHYATYLRTSGRLGKYEKPTDTDEVLKMLGGYIEHRLHEIAKYPRFVLSAPNALKQFFLREKARIANSCLPDATRVDAMVPSPSCLS